VYWELFLLFGLFISLIRRQKLCFFNGEIDLKGVTIEF
jgi:hypothetical protein